MIYTAVFGAGIWYILRLMNRPPRPLEPTVAEHEDGPIRTAGITPAGQRLRQDQVRAGS